MDDIKTKEKNLFNKWAQSLHLSAQDFCPNGGLLFRGKFYLNEPDEYNQYTWGRHSGNECSLWCNSCKRLMILTKDLNDDELWDIREESGGRYNMFENRVPQDDELLYKGIPFYRKINRWVYGIYNESHGKYPAFNDIKNEYNKLGRFYENAPLVRINCKREVGKSSVENHVLKNAMNKDKLFLTEQLKLYKANIILCCGYTEKTGNIILNFVRENYLHDLKEVESTEDWIYFSNKLNTIVINSYHPSATILDDESSYDELMKNFVRGIAISGVVFSPIRN